MYIQPKLQQQRSESYDRARREINLVPPERPSRTDRQEQTLGKIQDAMCPGMNNIPRELFEEVDRIEKMSRPAWYCPVCDGVLVRKKEVGRGE